MAEGLGALRVLVVDDNKQMRTIVGTVLSAAGVRHLHYAPDGREALALLREIPVDVAYVDHEMPGLSGVELVKKIRGLPPPTSFLPLIMLTGHSAVSRLNEARDAGVNEFLGKPVTATAILRRLDAVIMKPRPFVSSSDFFGPDRRRRSDAGYRGPKRRASDARGAVEI
jgi:CheY-like chemotaxis protein